MDGWMDGMGWDGMRWNGMGSDGWMDGWYIKKSSIVKKEVVLKNEETEWKN